MILHIKYMVSLRCKMLVKSELEKLGLHWISVDLGVVEIREDVTSEQLELFRRALKKSGLELLDGKKNMLIEQIKNVIVEMIHYTDEFLKVNDSDYISQKVGYDYTYLSNMFSETTGITVQQFIITHKIERVKELLLYNELTLTEIAHRMQYSSVAHLSNQFKKITGLTPTFFKSLREKRLQNLEDM